MAANGTRARCFPARSARAARARGGARRGRPLHALALALLVLAIAASPAHAAVVVWNGLGADNNFSTPGNWVGGVAPGPADVATFNVTSAKPAVLDPGHGGVLSGIDIQAAYTGSVTLGRSLTTTANLSQAGATFSGGAFPVTIGGSYVQTGGTHLATSGTMQVAVNFTHTAGTFTNNSGTVLLNSANLATVSGATTFYNLTISDVVAKQVNFSTPAADIQRVDGAFTVAGSAGNPMTLRSTTAGTFWHLDPRGTTSASWVDVKDGGCENTARPIYASNATNSGNNEACWQVNGIPPVTNLTVAPSNTSALLMWTNPADPRFDHVLVYRRTAEAAVPTLVYTSPNNLVTTYNDTGLTAGTTYLYDVLAVDVGGNGASAVFGAWNATYYADTGFGTLRWQQSDGSVNINYGTNGPDNGVLYPGPDQLDNFGTRWYGVLNIPVGGSYSFAHTVDDSVTTTIDGVVTGSPVVLTAGVHRFAITHVENGGGAQIIARYSGPGIANQVIPNGELGSYPLAEATPNDSNISVTAPAGGSLWEGAGRDVAITWTATGVAPAIGGVRLSYTTDGGTTWQYITRTIANSGSYTWALPPALNSANVRIRVETRQANGRYLQSAIGPAFTVHTLQSPMLANVTNLDVVGGNGQVQLSWTNPGPPFDHVNIYRTTSEGRQGTLVGQTAGTSFLDNTVINGSTYLYTVKAADVLNQEVLAPPPNLQMSSYTDTAWTNLRFRDVAANVAYNWGTGGPSSVNSPNADAVDNFSVRWYGQLDAPTAGTYYLTVSADDTGGTYVDGVQVNSGDGRGAITLTAGRHLVTVTEIENGGGAQITVSYSGPGIGQQTIPAAAFGSYPVGEATANDGSVSFVTPAGGESYRGPSSNASVTWNTTGTTPAIGSLRMSFSVDNGVTWSVVKVGISNTGATTWQLPVGVTTATGRLMLETRTATGHVIARAVSNAFTVDTVTDPSLGNVSGLQVVSSSGQNDLSWTNPGAPFDHANIYRSTSEGYIGTRVGQTNGATFSDTLLTNGITYYYTVKAANAADQEVDAPPAMLQGSHYTDTTFTNMRFHEVTANVNYNYGTSGPISAYGDAPGTPAVDNFTSRFYGQVYLPNAGDWGFTESSDDAGWIYVDGTQVTNSGHGMIRLTAGWHQIIVQHQENGGGAQISATYAGPGVASQIIPGAALGSFPTIDGTPSDDTLAITSPAAASTWHGAGAAIPVTFTATGTTPAVSSLRMSYSLDDGATWHVAAVGIPNTGTTTWQMPANVSSSTTRLKLETRAANGRVTRWVVSGAFTINTMQDATVGNVTGLVVKGADTAVNLSWANPGAPFDHVNIYRSTVEGQVGTYLASTAGSTYTDNAVTNGTTYHYTVKAATVTDAEVLTPPSNLTEYAYGDTTFTTLRYTSSSPNVNFSYGSGPRARVEYPASELTDNFSTRWVGQIYAPTTGVYYFNHNNDDAGNVWVDSAMVTGSATSTTYLTAGWHQVVMTHIENGGGATAIVSYSGPSIGYQVIPAGVLGAYPTGEGTPGPATVTVTGPAAGTRFGGAGQQMNVTWGTAGAGISSVGVLYSPDGGATWRVAARNEANDGAFTFAVPPGIKSSNARMRIEARNAAGRVLTWDDTGDLDWDTRMPGVTALTLTPGDDQVHLAWTNPVDAAFDHVNVYRATSSTGPFTLLGSTSGTSYDDLGLAPVTTYYYRVLAADVWDRETTYIRAGSGIVGSYYDGNNLNTFRGSQVDANVNFNWGGGKPALVTGTDNFSVSWNGYFNATMAGGWRFWSNVDDGGRIWIDDAPVGTNWGGGDTYTMVYLTAGWHKIRYDFQEFGGGAVAILNMIPPSGGGFAVVPGANFGQADYVSVTTAAIPAPDQLYVDDANAQPGSANNAAVTAPAPHLSWRSNAVYDANKQRVQVVTTPLDQVLGLWHMDTATGAAADASGSGRTLTLAGAPTSPAGKTGFSQSLGLNGTTQYASAAAAGALDLANNFTVEAWFRRSGLPSSTMSIVEKGGALNRNFHLYMDTTGAVGTVVTRSGSDAAAIVTPSSYADGQWHHAAMTVDTSNNLRLYVDGQPIGGPVAIGGVVTGGMGQAVLIGRYGTSAAGYWAGELDDVRISGVARSAAEVLGYYRTQLPHYTTMWDSDPTDAGVAMTTCSTATRCDDVAYGATGSTPIDLIRGGARYYATAKFKRAASGQWSNWSTPDWFETQVTLSLNLTTGASVGLGTVMPATDATGTASMDVTTNNASGYTLAATNESDAYGMTDGGTNTMPGWTGTPATPTTWPALAAGGFGLTVLSATGGKDTARWGTGVLPTDFVNLKYAGPLASQSATLHSRTSYSAGTDTVGVGLRVDTSAGQTAGSYSTQVTFTAVANP